MLGPSGAVLPVRWGLPDVQVGEESRRRGVESLRRQERWVSLSGNSSRFPPTW
jgi:hypothetical protein